MLIFSDCRPNYFNGGHIGEPSRLVAEQPSGKPDYPLRLQLLSVDKDGRRPCHAESQSLVVIDSVKSYLSFYLFHGQCTPDIFLQRGFRATFRR